MCVDATTTSHFCGDVLPSFLKGSNAGIAQLIFLTLHCFLADGYLGDARLIVGYYLFVCDMHFAMQHIYFFDIVIFPRQFLFSQAIAALLAVNQN